MDRHDSCGYRLHVLRKAFPGAITSPATTNNTNNNNNNSDGKDGHKRVREGPPPTPRNIHCGLTARASRQPGAVTGGTSGRPEVQDTRSRREYCGREVEDIASRIGWQCGVVSAGEGLVNGWKQSVRTRKEVRCVVVVSIHCCCRWKWWWFCCRGCGSVSPGATHATRCINEGTRKPGAVYFTAVHHRAQTFHIKHDFLLCTR